MTMTRFNSIMLGGFGLVFLIAAHGVVAWGGIRLSGTIGGSLPWIAGGALAFGLYHAVQAFGLYSIFQHVRGNSRSHFRIFGGHARGRGEIERGPHDGFLVDLGHGFVEITIVEAAAPPRFRLFLYDKHKHARPVPRNAIVTIETVRPGDTRQTFDFRATGDCLESTTAIPEPHEFKAILHVSHGTHTHPPHEVYFSNHDRVQADEG
jgi:hypothetical protein